MRNPGPSGALTALLLAIAAVFAWRVSPLAANMDDQVRLYFGGYVGAAQLGGGARAAGLRAEVERTTAAIADEYLASRFVTAQTPYSPLTMAAVASAEALRPLLGPRRVLPWILREQTLLWAVMLALAVGVRAWLPACPLAWFLAVSLALSWIHAHTSPLYPVPRAFACLFTGLALALAATGASPRGAAACLALAGFAHPYSQALNLAVALPAAALLAETPAAPALRRRGGLVLATVAIASLAAALAVLYAANPRSVLGVGTILGERAAIDFGHNWEMSRTLLQRLSVAIGLPLLGLVFRYAGPRRAAALGAFLLATLLAAGLLAPAGHYPTEYLSRIGAAWSAVLFGLCLRSDLLPDLASLAWPRRLAVIALACLVALPAAAPELAAVPQTIHRPWGGWPQGIRLSPVELECLRILRQTGNWPARR
jgi:hypothetical protein